MPLVGSESALAVDGGFGSGEGLIRVEERRWWRGLLSEGDG